MEKKFSNDNFHLYTEIVFGKDTEHEVAKLVRKYGGTKVMVVTGSASAKKSGLLDTVISLLEQADIPVVEFSGVKANPQRSFAEKGYQLAVDEGVDFLLGVGGASAIDTAKAIALGLANEGGFWQFYSGESVPKKMAPVGTIHTLAAAGSETSGSTVLVDDISGSFAKKGMMYPDVVRPVFAIMNPELTYSVNRYQTAAGASDILAHTFDRYFNSVSCALSDEFSEGLMRTVIRYTKKALDVPNDYEARAELMLAGSFSHNGLTGLGGKSPSAGTHNLEANLSGNYDTVHGAGLALVMPPWLEEVLARGTDSQIDRVAHFAVNVFGVYPDYSDAKSTALQGIHRFRGWLDSIGMPNTLNALGIGEEKLDEIVANCRCAPDGIMHGYIDFDKKQVKDFFSRLIER